MRTLSHLINTFEFIFRPHYMTTYDVVLAGCVVAVAAVGP